KYYWEAGNISAKVDSAFVGSEFNSRVSKENLQNKSASDNNENKATYAVLNAESDQLSISMDSLQDKTWNSKRTFQAGTSNSAGLLSNEFEQKMNKEDCFRPNSALFEVSRTGIENALDDQDQINEFFEFKSYQKPRVGTIENVKCLRDVKCNSAPDEVFKTEGFFNKFQSFSIGTGLGAQFQGNKKSEFESEICHGGSSRMPDDRLIFKNSRTVNVDKLLESNPVSTNPSHQSINPKCSNDFFLNISHDLASNGDCTATSSRINDPQNSKEGEHSNFLSFSSNKNLLSENSKMSNIANDAESKCLQDASIQSINSLSNINLGAQIKLQFDSLSNLSIQNHTQSGVSINPSISINHNNILRDEGGENIENSIEKVLSEPDSEEWNRILEEQHQFDNVNNETNIEGDVNESVFNIDELTILANIKSMAL
ncbi:hypothetical protein ROZALSC1DRAFT_25722, partial [Rozella allomycis CSF55]